MKFKDGYWRLRPGVRADYATAAHDVTADARSLRILGRPAFQRRPRDHPVRSSVTRSPV
ncbi:hypothetical protein [Nonomuraea sp. NPDC003201]